MGQQRIPAVEDVRDGVPLMLPKGDFRVHPGENDVRAVKLAGPGTVETLVIGLHQRVPALRVLPYPFPESVFDGLLLLLGQGRFPGIEDAAFLAVRVFDCIVNAHVPQVQGIFQDFVSVDPGRAEGGIGRHVHRGNGAFVGDVPFGGIGGKVYGDGPSVIGPPVIAPYIPNRRVEGFVHELLDVFLVHPGRAQAHVDFRSVQILGLGFFQRLHVDVKDRGYFRRCPGFPQLLPYVAGQVLVRRHIPGLSLIVSRLRQPEDHAGQFLYDLLLRFST